MADTWHFEMVADSGTFSSIRRVFSSDPFGVKIQSKVYRQFSISKSKSLQISHEIEFWNLKMYGLEV